MGEQHDVDAYGRRPSPRGRGCNSGAALAASATLRRTFAGANHEERLKCVRRLVLGSHGHRSGEILRFADFARVRNLITICEIGTLMGGTSLFRSGLAPSVRMFVGIDLKIHNARLVASLVPPAVDVVHIEGSSRMSSVRESLVAALNGRPLDLLFIDGDHEYEGVKADLTGYRDVVVVPGGPIAFHDIIDDRGSEFWSGDVPGLRREISDLFLPWEFVDDPAQHSFGIGVIEHDPAIEIE